MGKPTGFLEYDRELPGKRDPKERTQDYRELYLDFDENSVTDPKTVHPNI